MFDEYRVSVPGGGKVLETDSGGDLQYECT